MPFAGTTQAISTFVWLLALAYLYTEVTTDERGLGVFILTIIVALQILPAIRGPGVEPRSPVLEHPLFWTHVAALLGAYASFGLAAVIGITYVLQFKEIKAKHLVFFFERLPSLQVLDVMNSRTVFIGWLLLTVGLGAGALWVAEALAMAPSDPRVQAMSLSDPEDLGRADDVGGLHVSARRAARDRLAWAAGGVSRGGGLRDRPAQLRAGQLLPDRKPQLRGLRCICFSSAPVTARRPWTCVSGSISAAAVSRTPCAR